MDEEKVFVLNLLEEMREKSNGKKPRKKVYDLIKEAYNNDFHKISDGCTVVSEYGFKYKHPTCVGHDFLYNTQTFSRYEADYWFLLANIDFDHKVRGFIRFIGVRIGGFFLWKKKKKSK